MYIRIYILGICFCLAGFSCERDANIRVHQTKQDLVVEGIIEKGKAPRVIITHSLNFFSAIDASLLDSLFVHHAQITVSNNRGSVRLVEKKVDTLFDIPYYYYEPEHSRDFIGRAGGTYTLHIEAEGQTLNAVTTIPSGGFYLDSIWWIPGRKESKPDSSKAYLMARIFDPPRLGDYARYYTKCNSEPFYPGIASVAEDDVTNGKVFDFRLSRGVNKNMEIDLNDFGYFEPGDTVTLKFCNIDEVTYRFWSTWEYAWSNSSNPFASPTQVQGNIPGALGYWGGYNAQYKSLIIPK